MDRVLANEIAYSAEEGGIYLWNGEPFTGIAYTTYPDGQLRSESAYRYGLGWGTSRGWYPDGILSCETTLYRDVVHGLSREWSPSGRLLEEIVAEYGVVLRRRVWDEEGVLVEEYRLKEENGNYELLRVYRSVTKDDEAKLSEEWLSAHLGAC